jgi:hypothetical protein
MCDVSIENGACGMLDHQDLRRSHLGRAMILVSILFGLIVAGLPLDLQSLQCSVEHTTLRPLRRGTRGCKYSLLCGYGKATTAAAARLFPKPVLPKKSKVRTPLGPATNDGAYLR